MTRRELREHCFKMLFSANFYDAEEAERQLDNYFDAPEEDETDAEGHTEVLHQVTLEEKDREYLQNRVEQIIEAIPELDAALNQVAEGWKTRRMGKVELTILRLALYEMKKDETVPEKVAINEAVELAKKFGGSDSPAFVNGILAKLV
ncbi:MAG TPA: transcription antitermination factor NusB [Candidatus Lachnoclostridium stercoripullorum]|uniref:Transcription antitermination protein NusB n=1 Tax=Candidatus Lachnoclostridium stercoripullorum TaxID=2838635 RepID=A0A9D1W3J0_9FIRM|nr:transcription antitermination factor NusB [Candidatus Lachnoclostridium stercoripullorum]